MQKKFWHSLSLGVCLLTFGCGKENATAPNPAVEPAKISNFDSIRSARDKKSLVGQTVNIGNVQVTPHALSDYFFWVGDAGTAIPVARLDKLNATTAGKPITYHVRSADKVRIVGTMKSTDTLDATSKLWPTNARERQAVKDAGVYIEAVEVDFVSR